MEPLRTIETYRGESLEEKLQRLEDTGEPIEAVSPMLYTERKDGVLPETDIRSDKWDNAMMTMDKLTMEHRKGRAERIMKELQGQEQGQEPAKKEPETQA